MALRDKDIDLSKEYNSKDNTLENEELNSTRFKNSYISFLDLLNSLYPNAFGTQLLVKYGLPTEFTEEVPNLSADKLDWMLDVDHFAKDIKVGSGAYDLNKKENREHFAKLFKTAVALFSSEDKLKMSLPDFGDTSVSKTNGGLNVKYGKDYLLSNMDSRYSDMKYYGVDSGKVDADGNKIYNEVNSFSFDKTKYSDENKQNLLNFATIFDLNNDGLIGTDDAVLILVAYAHFIALKRKGELGYAPIIETSADGLLTYEYRNSSFLGDFDRASSTHLVNNHLYTYVSSTNEIENAGHERVYYFYQDNKSTDKINIWNPKDNNKNQSILIQLHLGNSCDNNQVSKYLYGKAVALEKIREWGVFDTLQFKNKNTEESFNSEIAVFILRLIAKIHHYTRQYVTIEEFADELANMFKLGSLSTDDLVNSDGSLNNNDGKVYENGTGTNTESVVSSEGWNESINGLYSLIKDWCNNYGLTPRDNINVADLVKELNNADAKGDGDNDETLLHPVPFTNLLKQNYKQARRDEIKQNDIFMDYTNRMESVDEEGKVKIVKEIMNLIMPAYKRRVEVEDLDKNFWVISTVVGAIVDVLFGNDGLRGILKGQAAETMELWNNVKYLWNVIDVQAKMINDLALANIDDNSSEDVSNLTLKKNLFQYKTNQQLNSSNLLNMSGELLDLNGDGYVGQDDAVLMLKVYASFLAKGGMRLAVEWGTNSNYSMVGTITNPNNGVIIMKIGLNIKKVTTDKSGKVVETLITNPKDYNNAISTKTGIDNFYRSCTIFDFNYDAFVNARDTCFKDIFVPIDFAQNNEIRDNSIKWQSSLKVEHISMFKKTNNNWSKCTDWLFTPIATKDYFAITPSDSSSTEEYDLIHYDSNGESDSYQDGSVNQSKRFMYSRFIDSNANEPYNDYIGVHLNNASKTRGICPKLKRCAYTAGVPKDSKDKELDTSAYYSQFMFLHYRDTEPQRNVSVGSSQFDLIYRSEDDEDTLRTKFFLKVCLASFWYGSSYQKYIGTVDSKVSVGILKVSSANNRPSLSNTDFNDNVYQQFLNSLSDSDEKVLYSGSNKYALSKGQINMLMVMMENEKGQHYDISYSSKRRVVMVESKDGSTISKVTVLKSEDDDYNKAWNDDKANLYYIPNGDMLAGGGTELIKEDSRSSLDVWLPDYKVGGAFPSYMSLDLNE